MLCKCYIFFLLFIVAISKLNKLSIQVKQNHMDELNRTAIIIVRNPFAAIIGHRHLVSEISKV